MAVGRIYDRLVDEFGKTSFFRDIDDIPLGSRFTDHIERTFDHCRIMLAVIGKDWLGERPDGTRRIDETNDPVRLEIEAGLHRQLAIVPLVIEPATLPNANSLPPSIQDLAIQNGMSIDPGLDFDVHVQRLIKHLKHMLENDGRPQAERKLESRDDESSANEKQKRRPRDTSELLEDYKDKMGLTDEDEMEEVEFVDYEKDEQQIANDEFEKRVDESYDEDWGLQLDEPSDPDD